ncbi:hypothetical protein FB451DRAFT_1380243 [Mycena latifolia]|nr:hypothetical protein FB451DRAFT_1380243 [Mycena latifolia]
MATNYTTSGLSLDGTFGVVEIGTAVGTFLFGILTLQTFNYYRQFPGDSRLLKMTVYCITVTSYGQAPDAFILQPPRLLIFTLLFTVVIDSLVQVFFSNRIRVLSGRPHVFFLCLTMAVLLFICDMAVIQAVWRSNTGLLVLESKLHWLTIVAIALAPAGDFVIALSMCYYLWHIRESGPQFRRYDLIIWTVGECSAENSRYNDANISSSVVVVMELVLQQFLTRTDLSFMALYLIQPKCENIPGDWIQNTD